MDVKEKLVELLSVDCCPNDGCDFCDYAEFEGCRPHFLADHLIANGVTLQENAEISDELFKRLRDAPITVWKEESSIAPVQEWIPVTERLPDKDGDYLVFKRFAGNAWSDVVSFAQDGRKVGECAFGEKWQNVWYYYDSEWGYMRTDAVTHWMPLPQPPKGE